MKIFLAGASGVIGRSLTPLLLEAGHEVIALARHVEPSTQNRVRLRWHAADVYDRTKLEAVFAKERPDIVMHQLTDLKEQSSEANAKLRTIGTRNLVEAALSVGVRSIVAQSISWAYVPGEEAATENTPLDRDAAPPRRMTIDGIVALESTVMKIPHYVTLRFGTLYGPGTWYGRDGSFADSVRSGQLGSIPAITNFTHVDDAAEAALQAMDWPSGVVNIVDGDPARATEWLPLYAQELHVAVPSPMPTTPDLSRRVSNALARKLGWAPKHTTWKNGLLSAISKEDKV